MNADELYESFNHCYPHVGLQIQHVDDYLNAGNEPNVDYLMDWVIENGLYY